jgi:trk system potassium uptake protein TrkH
MILRPSADDVKVIGFYVGKLTVALGLVKIIPVAVSLIFREWSPAVDFTIGSLVCIAMGLFLQILCKTDKDMEWVHGLTVAALSWVMAMFMGSIPMFLSGHFVSYVDAAFDAMSGFATTGLVLIQDIDHVSNGLNMWRHLMMFIGGQGIIVIGLTFLLKGTAGAYRMYVGEAREEKILPNVIQTARFIWYVSLTYLAIGTTALTAIGISEGMRPVRALLHGIWIFIAAFDTGGFTPQSQNILYYHSFPYEIVTVVIMILGTINFALHYALWSGNRKEIRKNVEIISLVITTTGIFALAASALRFSGVYPTVVSLFRKGFYQVISAHSGTGYSTIYSSQFVGEWGPLAMFAITLAMAFGGSASSTAGGIKALRIATFFKALRQDIKKIMSPFSAVVVEKFHHIKDLVLEEKFVRNSMIILICYVATYLLGCIVGMFYGYPLNQALFESVSATANVGLSCGITAPTMPTAMKVVYIIQMWVGRLEFISIFALFGFIIAGIKGK